MRPSHRSEVQLGARTIIVESALGDGSSPELITRYAENDMTTRERRDPIVGVSSERSIRSEASLGRQMSASHLASVQELLSQPADDSQDIQTAKNLAKNQPLEPHGILLSFCLAEPPDNQRFSERKISLTWLDAIVQADKLARLTAEAFGSEVATDHVIVHGDAHAAHLLGGPRGTRACIVDLADLPSEATIISRLERLACAR